MVERRNKMRESSRDVGVLFLLETSELTYIPPIGIMKI